ncbi:MAG: hypothetical protein AB1757_04735 [Acidobacteriota bacterium]
MTGRRFILSLITTPMIAAVLVFSASVYRDEQSWVGSSSSPMLRLFLFALIAQLFIAVPCLTLMRYRGIRLLTASVSGGTLAGLISGLIAPLFGVWSFINTFFLLLIVGAFSGVIFWFTAFWKSGYEVQEVD